MNCCLPTPLNHWTTRHFLVNVSWSHRPPFNLLPCHVSPSTPAVNQCPPQVSPPPPPVPHLVAESQTLRSIVLRLVNVCSANQDTIPSFVDNVRTLRLEVSRSRPPLAHLLHPCRPAFVRRLQPTGAHQPVVGCHLSLADVLDVKILPTWIVQPVSATHIAPTLLLCLPDVPPSASPRTPSASHSDTDTPCVVTLSHHPPIRSPPYSNTAALNQLILSGPLDTAIFIATAADAHTILVSPRETTRVQCLGGSHCEPTQSRPSELCTVECAQCVDVGRRPPRRFPWFDVSLDASLSWCCLCARNPRSTPPATSKRPTLPIRRPNRWRWQGSRVPLSRIHHCSAHSRLYSHPMATCLWDCVCVCVLVVLRMLASMQSRELLSGKSWWLQ